MKRKYKEFEELQNKSFPITSGSSKVLLCEKYAPKLEKDLLIRKDKIKSIKEIMTDPNTNFLFLIGPSGSCKRSLVTAMSKEMGYSILKYSPTKYSNVQQRVNEFKRYHPRAKEGQQLTEFQHFIQSISERNKKAGRGCGQPIRGLIGYESSGEEEENIYTGQVGAGDLSPISLSMMTQSQTYVGSGRSVVQITDWTQIVSAAKRVKGSNIFTHWTRTLGEVAGNTQALFVFIITTSEGKIEKVVKGLVGGKVFLSSNTRVLQLNPIIEGQIEKRLLYISNNEGMTLSKLEIHEIVIHSTRDIRVALNTLQLFKTARPQNFTHLLKRVKEEESSQMPINTAESKVMRDIKVERKGKMNIMNPRSKSKGKGRPKLNMGYSELLGTNEYMRNSKLEIKNHDQDIKDHTLTIFHGFGKLLYNKRLNPQKPNEDPKQFTHEEFMELAPVSYYNPEKVLNSLAMPNDTKILWLYENSLNFSTDIQDLSEIYDYYSMTTSLNNYNIYCSSSTDSYEKFTSLTSSIAGRALIFHNTHLAKTKNVGLSTITKPQIFEKMRELQKNNQILSEFREFLVSKSRISFPDLILTQSRKIPEYFAYINEILDAQQEKSYSQEGRISIEIPKEVGDILRYGEQVSNAERMHDAYIARNRYPGSENIHNKGVIMSGGESGTEEESMTQGYTQRGQGGGNTFYKIVNNLKFDVVIEDAEDDLDEFDDLVCGALDEIDDDDEEILG